MKIIILLFLAVGSIFAANDAASVYILNNKAPQAADGKIPIRSVDSYMSLLSHNLGLLDSVPNDSEHVEMIENFKSNQNIFHPLTLNYMFVFETKNPASLKYILRQGANPSFQLRANQAQKSILPHILDNLYNTDGSLKSKSNSRTDDQVFYLFTDDAATVSKYQDSAIFVSGSDQDTHRLNIAKDSTSYKLAGNLKECLNPEFAKRYSFDLEERTIYKFNTDTHISFTEEQEPAVVAFLQDLCAISRLPSHLSIKSQPLMLTIYIKGLSAIEQELNLKEAERDLIYEIFGAVVKKFEDKITKKFQHREVTGHLIPVQVEHETVSVVQQKRLLAQIKQTTNRRKSKLEGGANATDPTSRLIYIWFIVGFFFMLAFILITFFTEEQPKDTLLYAKFITMDNQGR